MVFQAFKETLFKNVILVSLLLLVIIGAVLTSLIPPQILKNIIDHQLALTNKQGLLLLACLYLITLIGIGLFDFIKEAILTILGQKINITIRSRMMEKLERIRASYFSLNDTGTIVSRFTNDVEAINVMFSSGIVSMVVDSLKIIGIVGSIWIFSAKLGMMTLFLLPLIYFVTRQFQKRMLKAQTDNRRLVGSVNNLIAESIKNVRMIKSFSKEQYMESKYKSVLLDNYQTVEKVNFYDSIFPPVIQITRACIIGAIVVFSSDDLNVLDMSLGMIAASIELFSNLFAPIENLGMELQNIQTAISGVKRVDAFAIEDEDAPKIAVEIDDYTLDFEDVCFAYEPGIEVLQNISLSVHGKEKVTFVGRTGVGKSTLFKLIMGLLEPTSGRVTIGGIDVYSIPNHQKRSIFGYVDQTFHMIKGSVADQITLKDPSITRESVEKVLTYVGLNTSIALLNDGYDTFVHSETMFSHGQKQLLGIARAIVCNPPVLLLDEITSNLDSVTEEKVVSVLRKIAEERMVLSISHRLTSILASDMLILLENGRIINSGSPDTLIQSDPWYRRHLSLESMTWD
jgi:ATP-binding cassette subfamily B protein